MNSIDIFAALFSPQALASHPLSTQQGQMLSFGDQIDHLSDQQVLEVGSEKYFLSKNHQSIVTLKFHNNGQFRLIEVVEHLIIRFDRLKIRSS